MFISAQSAKARSQDHTDTPHPAFIWPDDQTWRRDAERNATKRRALAALSPLADTPAMRLSSLMRRLLGLASA